MVIFSVKYYAYRIGMPDFLWCFFSTITKNLEPDGMATRFPRTMYDLCGQSNVANEHLDELKEELATIKAELSKLPVNKVVYDYEEPELTPPWQDNLADDITNLGNYFRVSDRSKCIFDVLNLAIEDAKRLHEPLKIETL